MKTQPWLKSFLLFALSATSALPNPSCYKRTEFFSKEHLSTMSSLMSKLDYCGSNNYKTTTDIKVVNSANGDKVYRIRYTNPNVNKGKAVYVFLPLNANLRNLSVSTYFHGDGFNENYLNVGSNSKYNIGNKISGLLNKNPDQAYIVPIGNYPDGLSDRLQSNEPEAFSKIISASMNVINDMKNSRNKTSRCINPTNHVFLNNYKTGNILGNSPLTIKSITHNFHSAGGWALSNAIKNNDLIGDKINLLDANYKVYPYHKETPLEVLMKYCDSYIVRPAACRKDNIGVWYTDHGCNLSRESIIKYQAKILPFYYKSSGSAHDMVPLDHLGSDPRLLRSRMDTTINKCR